MKDPQESIMDVLMGRGRSQMLYTGIKLRGVRYPPVWPRREAPEGGRTVLFAKCVRNAGPGAWIGRAGRGRVRDGMHSRVMKLSQSLVMLVVLLGAIVPAGCERLSSVQELGPSTGRTQVAPIETLWWIVAEALTETNAPVVRVAVEQWQGVGTFDAFAVGVLPPTFIDLEASTTLVN